MPTSPDSNDVIKSNGVINSAYVSNENFHNTADISHVTIATGETDLGDGKQGSILKDPSLVVNGSDGAKKSDVRMFGKMTSYDVSEKEGREKERGGGCCGKIKSEKAANVGVLELFRHSSPVEIVMMVVGTLAAMATGCCQPISTIVTGSVIDSFIDNAAANTTSGNGTLGPQALKAAMQDLVLYYLYLAVAALSSACLSVILWKWAGQRHITRIRKLFFRGVMRQDMAWFDTHPVSQLNSTFSDDMHKIEEGLGDKVPVFVYLFSQSVASCVIAFIKDWKLTLVILSFSPVFVLILSTTNRFLRGMTLKELKAYATAGSVAEQALRAIRTVQAFQGQEKEQARYEQNLVAAQKQGTRKGLVLGGGFGLLYLFVYVSFAVGFYYGVILIQEEGLQPGNVVVVFACVLFGSLSMGNAFPNIEVFANARAAAVKAFHVIDLHPDIDISSTSGITLSALTGLVHFRDVHFRYPARPDVPILNGLSLEVRPGQTVALVGSSGCGKSTALQLLQRLYDPQHGQITVDGHDIRDLNLNWLRSQMGVVSQEPVLFATTIADNIRHGQRDVTIQDVQAAAVKANAHQFISRLPQGYETLVGERGAQLSGGQKQRIAIARALLANPRILLLDEATSALDTHSEALVQAALDTAREGRTTIVIAHRLSTIRHADVIITLDEGKKREEGSHEQLMDIQGQYAHLVRLQSRREEEEEKAVNEDVDEDKQEDDVMSASPTSSRKAHVTSRQDSNHSDSNHMNTEQEEEEEAGEGEEKEKEVGSMLRLIRLNSPEWCVLSVALFQTVVCGMQQPMFAFIFPEFLRVFSLPDEGEQLSQAGILSAVIVAISLLICICRISSSYCFSKAGAALTSRLRSLTFSAILKQDMSFFDEREHQVGVLTTRLARDAALVQGATGSKLGNVMESLSTVTVALVIAFVYGWKLTLVILSFMPVVLVCGKVQAKMVRGTASSSNSSIVQAGKICSEAVDNMRTVMALNTQNVFIHKMDNLLQAPVRSELKSTLLFGLTYSLSVSIQYLALCATFSYGGDLVASGEMQFYDVFRIFAAVVGSSTAAGRNASLGVDYIKGRLAAGRLFALIDTQPRINIDQPAAKTLKRFSGQVSVESAWFEYPTRQTVRVLRGLTLSVQPGHTLALVGSSGCGKSTLLQLMQRFYDTSSGALLLDGHDVKTLDLRWVRQQLGVVSQEPTLFDDTIANNIAYGDNSRHVPMDDVIAAARDANIHNFICSLPDGYETRVGDKGTQLSGGQKQRIAIARALLRRPSVLLLDEATSALDTESERVVQDALDKARDGRTCIVIAHRLTTIQNADVIAVIQDGRVQEMGSHSQLLAQGGAYYNLLTVQRAFKHSL